MCSKFVFILLLFIKDVLVCCVLNPPPLSFIVQITHHLLQRQHINHWAQNKPMLSLWKHHYLSDGNRPITTKCPQSPVCVKNLTKLRACWLKKGFVFLYMLVFCSCVFIVGIPVNSPSVQFMHGILSTPWCRQKQQSALKIGKKWRVLKQPAGLS